jgi:peptidoglycan/xylan/chitin deacetylase (PgdA/CDA1 family)
MAVLVGTLLAGSAGYTLVQQQPVSGVPARTLISTGGDGGQATPSSATKANPAVAASAPKPAAPEGPAYSVARVAPFLEAVEPKTADVPVNTAIVMTFSQAMNRPSVEMSFAIHPVVEGRFVWRDDFTLRFEAFKLGYATTYQVEVRGRSERGVPLSGSRWWSFSTVAGPPDVLAPGPAALNVPILTYHYIRVNPDRYDRMGFALSVTPADFAAQMDWLARNGYHPITTEDLYAFLQGARGLPSKPVILTFDDGYTDFFTTALPVLISHDFRAEAYVVSGFVGQPGYMTAAQVREADRSGIEIGSHTVSHANLATASFGAVRAQIAESKAFLEQLIGHPVVSFCYPSGKFNSAVASQVAAAGYHDATTTYFGYRHALGDRYIWTRLRVSGGEPLDQFAAAVRTAS